jgi:hypothetical protein
MRSEEYLEVLWPIFTPDCLACLLTDQNGLLSHRSRYPSYSITVGLALIKAPMEGHDALHCGSLMASERRF